MRTVLNWCFGHLFGYKEHAQKLFLGFMLFGVTMLPACPVCFCDELGWPDHITVTYNVGNPESKKDTNSYTVEILCSPLKESGCTTWHDEKCTSKREEISTHAVK